MAHETTTSTKAVRQNERTSLLEKNEQKCIVLGISQFQAWPSASSKLHWIQDIYMENVPKKTKLYSCFLLLRIYPDSPVHMSANTECIQICPVTL